MFKRGSNGCAVLRRCDEYAVADVGAVESAVVLNTLTGGVGEVAARRDEGTKVGRHGGTEARRHEGTKVRRHRGRKKVWGRL